MAVGIWVSVDGPSFLKVFGSLSSSAMQFVNVGYFLIAAGVVLFILGFLGCYGAHSENKCALMLVCWTQLPGPQPRVPPSSLTPLGSQNPPLDCGSLTVGTPCLLYECVGQGRCVSLKCLLVSVQFFSILLLIFIAEIAGAVVALVYTTMVRHWDGEREKN